MKNKPLINCIVEDGKFEDDFFGNLIATFQTAFSESLCEQW